MKIFMTNDSLIKVESIAECSNNLTWKLIFAFFQSGPFTQVLLYFASQNMS